MQTLLEFMNRDRLKKYKPYHPKTKNELVEIIHSLIKEDGWAADLNDIDTSKIDDMAGLFGKSSFESYGLEDFNGDISKWDVSEVKYMNQMFYKSKFNGDISKWNTKKVMNMTDMFRESDFNRDISQWDVRKVRFMGYMFYKSKFDKDISGWKPESIVDMFGMFKDSVFDRNIDNWQVGDTCNTKKMFENSPLEFNPPKWYNR